MSKKFYVKRASKMLGLIAMIMAALIMAACSGGSGGSGSGSVSALSLPDRIELTNVQDQNGTSRAAGLSRGAYNDAGSDYANQAKSSWVDDTDALDMINTVLGVCKETSYASFVNQGPYKALVRSVDDSKQAGSGSSTTSSTTEELMEIYVNVTRASNSDPMIVKIWLEVPNGPNDIPMLVRGYFEVSQGVSADYPYGVMTAHFKGNTLNNDGSEGAEVMQMALSVNAENGQVVLENVEDEFSGSNYMRQRRVQVVANSDVTEGNAYVMEKERDWNTNLYPNDWDVEQIAFNSDYFKVTTDTDKFYSKDNLKHRVFNYKLFDAVTGDKVELSSGFPIQTAAGKHGYVGYYGLWAPYGTTIASGDTVTDMDGNEYTVFRSSGKLTRLAQASMLLSALDGVELSKWGCSGNTCQDTVVAWESDTDQFLTLGYRNENGQIVYYVNGVDAEYHTPVTFQQWEGAYCESLQAFLRLGSLYFDSTNGQPTTPTDASTVYYHVEQTLNPSTAGAIDGVPLYTWEFTMATPIGQTEVDNYSTDFNNYWSSPVEKTFYFDAATMMLVDGSDNPITLGNLTIDADSNLNFGYHIGPLTTSHYFQNSSPYVWEAQEAPVYYSWNTGSDDWNQLVTVKDSNGNFVSFDAPISFSYTHTTANDVNGLDIYNGRTFRLQYDGFSVQIPWNFDETTDEWEPFINIVDGTLMGPNGDDYVIKATEESLVMAEIADPAIAFPSNSVGEPTLTYDATRTALVGAVPTTAELKVIKGELLE